MAKKTCTMVAIFAALIFASGIGIACNGGLGSTSTLRPAPTPSPSPTHSPVPTDTPVPMEILVLQPRVLTLEVGQTHPFKVSVLDQFENRLPDRDYSYVVTALSGVGQIDQDGNFTAGNAAGDYEGAVTVQVTQGSITRTATANVTISPGPLSHVSLYPSSATVRAGQTRRFTATATDQYDNPIAGVTFVFSGEQRAGQVDSLGNFTAGTKPGSFGDEITVKVSQESVSRTATARLTVTPGPLDQLLITPDPGVIEVGSRRRFTALGTDRFGNKIPVLSATWSLDAGGGNIDSSGNFTADSEPGTYSDTIKATVTQGNVSRSATASVAVVSIEAAAVSAGGGHTCVLTTGGGVKCWGNNWAGQLGDWSTTNRATPVDVIGLNRGVAAVSLGASHSCALTTTGRVKCWGRNAEGQLGDGTRYVNRHTPENVIGLDSGVEVISAGVSHTCAVTATGRAKCWGDNRWSELGDGTDTDSRTPVDVIGLTTDLAAVSGGGLHTCALSTLGGVKCWGANQEGQLGDGTRTHTHNSVSVVGLDEGVAAVSAGHINTCALTTSGGVKCWGLTEEEHSAMGQQ